MIRYFLQLVACILLFPSLAFSFPFTTVKRDATPNAKAMLIAAGIHGDEPSAFLAAGLIISHYTIHSGRLWIVPNINFQSILHTSRGIAGDMNRKFLGTHKNDPDYVNLEAIKALIKDDAVDFVYSMHDGSGFYRHKHISSMYSPYRWGQCVIIDQAELDPSIAHHKLENIAQDLVDMLNTKVIAKNEEYRIRNTKTAEGNTSMEQSLTWFTVQNNKATISIESSKNIPLHRGVYYHLLALEHVMKRRGITFERTFELNPEGVKKALYDVKLELFNSYTLPIHNLREELRFMPFANADVKFTAGNPLLYVYRKKNAYVVQYGNTILTTLEPEFIVFDTSLQNITLEVDGKSIQSPLGVVIPVKDSFFIPEIAGYRLNVIGYVHPRKKNEFGIKIHRKDMTPSYSIDTTEQTYRAEIYKGDTFAGLVYLQFPAKSTAKKIVPAKKSTPKKPVVKQETTVTQ